MRHKWFNEAKVNGVQKINSWGFHSLFEFGVSQSLYGPYTVHSPAARAAELGRTMLFSNFIGHGLNNAASGTLAFA